MRDEIIDMCVSALRRSGHSGLTRDSIRTDPAHARAMIALLKDCRPLPVVQDLIQDLEPVAGSSQRAPV